MEEGEGGHWLNRMAKRRGVMAKSKIRKGEVVLSVPFELLISVEGAEKSELQQVCCHQWEGRREGRREGGGRKKVAGDFETTQDRLFGIVTFLFLSHCRC
jgi:hypothetical protein